MKPVVRIGTDLAEMVIRWPFTKIAPNKFDPSKDLEKIEETGGQRSK